MTTLPGATVALQPLVWSSEPDLFAEAVVYGSFTNAELRELGDLFVNETQPSRPGDFYRDRNLHGALSGLEFRLCELRWAKRAFRGLQHWDWVVQMESIRRDLRRNAVGGGEVFQRAALRFAPRAEALLRAARDFNPVPQFDPGDFFERYRSLWSDFEASLNWIRSIYVIGDFWGELRRMSAAERALLREEALRVESKEHHWEDFYRFVVTEIDKLETSPAGRAA